MEDNQIFSKAQTNVQTARLKSCQTCHDNFPESTMHVKMNSNFPKSWANICL